MLKALMMLSTSESVCFSALNQQSWSNLKPNDIVVQQDMARLYGTARNEERRAIIFAANKLPEINRVESPLTLCVQPFL
jgi:hypothetical protein